MDTHRFDGMAALVTGAGAGLGRSHAIELARRGAKVMINDVAIGSDGRPTAQAAAEMLRAEGLTADFDTGSAGIESDATAMVARTVATYGKIDILVNNAGSGVSTSLQDTRTEDFLALLNVHLMGSLWTMRAALQGMRAQNYGRIINTSSALGAFGAPGSCAYVVAKAGLIGLTKSGANDNLDKDIRVNVLLPVAYTQMSKDYFDTRPELGIARLAPENTSPAVLYLAHRDCALNGEILSAGAGRVARVFTAAVPGYHHDNLTCENVFQNMDAVMDTQGFRILKSSIEQYDLIPKAGA